MEGLASIQTTIIVQPKSDIRFDSWAVVSFSIFSLSYTLVCIMLCTCF